MKTILIFLMLSFAVNVYGADFLITIPDDKVQGVVDAFASRYNYQETITNPDYDPEDPESEPTIPNISKTAFAKNCIKAFIRHIYISKQVDDVVEDTKSQATEQAIIDMEGMSVE